jgi:hypothetical protein
VDFDTEQLDSVGNGPGLFRDLAQACEIAGGRIIAHRK